jgi:alpha-D-xyloside xylohydrolase
LWTPEFFSGEINLTAGKNYKMVFTNKDSQEPGKVLYNKPDFGTTTFNSQYGNGVDYYFVAGNPKEVIAGYRQLTGTAPMFDKSVYGFWQCRERYNSQKELLDIAKEYRERYIPIDNIVQDWRYWPDKTWGPAWNREIFPSPGSMCKTLDGMHINLMVSVWPKVNNAKLSERYNLEKYKIGDKGNLDFYDPELRESFYKMLSDSMFNMGVKSIWLDGTEPEDFPSGVMTKMGIFDHNALAYSYNVTRSVYEGFKKQYPNRRLFNLTRSAFAGQQRFSAAAWSGDVSATWIQFREQITAGLNFSMSGLPYWTTDIGGFFRDHKSINWEYDNQYTNESYKELLTRWFQFGTFCPLFRIHGFHSKTEIWNYGMPFEKTARNFIDLRYQLMPYIYSTANQVTNQGGIVIKPLGHDYPDEPECWNIKDQFLFGDAMMVCPVTVEGLRKREVYLPEGNWVDFWEGKEIAGGKNIEANVPLERIPVYIKSGSILPVGQKIQYAMQKTTKPMRLYVYPGDNGAFELYEDEGENCNYEKGQNSRIGLSWNDSEKILTIGDRKGEYEGMASSRKFEIILVKEGFGKETSISKIISYDGSQQQIEL